MLLVLSQPAVELSRMAIIKYQPRHANGPALYSINSGGVVLTPDTPLRRFTGFTMRAS